MYNIKKINKNGLLTVFHLKHLFEKMLLFFSRKKMEKHQTFLSSEGKIPKLVDLKGFIASHGTV